MCRRISLVIHIGLFLLPLSLWLWQIPHAVQAFELEIQNGRLNVQADRIPLHDLLQRVSDFGIKVRIDPAINPPITASFENKELEAGLRAFLRPLNHVFIWKPAHAFVVGTVGGSGPYRLSEIQVFRPGQPGRMIFLDERPDPAARQVPAETGFETQDRETKIIIKGNRVYVPVVIAYNRQQVATTLIFDTGAGDIVLHHDLADRLGINDGKRAKGHGVGGIEIDALVTRLSSVKVGPYEKQNLRAAVVQYQGPEDTHYNGLLGMNFLRGMNYKIDFERSVIRWGAADQSPEP